LDKEVIERAKDGDETAMSEIYDFYKDYVLRSSFLMLRNREEAEDVSENVFLKTFTHMNSFDIERDFKPWLSRIILNESRNYLRKYRNNSSTKIDEEQQISNFNLPNEKVIDLKTSINKLSTGDRELVTLRFYQELTIEEISKILKIQKNTVKVRIHRAMKKLKEYLKNVWWRKRFSK